MKLKRFSKLDNFENSIKIINKKTGEVLSIKRFSNLLIKILSKIFKGIRDMQTKKPAFDIYSNNSKIAELILNERSEEELNIIWIEVYPGNTGKGIAQSILSELIKFAKSQKYKYLTLEVPGNSPDAKHIYEKLGFKEDGILTTPEEDEIWGGLTKMRLKLYSINPNYKNKKKTKPIGKQDMPPHLIRIRDEAVNRIKRGEDKEKVLNEVINKYTELHRKYK